MKKTKLSALTIAIALAMSTVVNAEPMAKTQYEASNKKIEADYKSDKAACESLSGNASDICLSEAKGKSKIAEADLEATYKPSTKNSYDANIAKADANYSVAKEKCDDKAGNAKDVCIKEAKAIKTRAISDAKVEMKSKKATTEANEESSDAKSKAMETKSDARKDAVLEKRDADYAVAKEKCDALAGDAKDQCIITAKTKFGQK